MHWENTHVLAIVEAMLIFWELTCVLSVVHWITWGNERNFRQCGPLSGSLYYNLTTTQQKDMRDLSNTWRHAGKERDTLQTWQPWWSTVWPLPIKRHVWSINHLETCWQGACHTTNMAAMVVHYLTSTHQEDMHALSNTWRHAGKEHDMTLSKHGSHGGPLSDHYPSRDMYGLSTIWRHSGKKSDTLQTWQPWWSTVWPLPIKRHVWSINHLETCWQGAWHSKHGSHGGALSDLYPSRGYVCPINHLETCWQGGWHTPNMAAMVVHCLTSTHQEDMHALSTIWRHAGKEGDTLQTWQPWWSTVWPLPIKRHVWSINHLETWWQGAWHTPNMAAMVVHCLTSTHQETCMVYQPSGDMLARSVTLSKHGSHGGPLCDLYPSRGHVCPINHLETCWQGAWHSPNMAAMVVHCQTSTHQEDMHALSTIWRHAGKERDTLQTWQPWWSTVWPLPIKRTCMPYQPPGDMGARSVTLQTWQPWWSTVWPLPIKRTCMPYQPPGDMLASTVGWAM